MNNKAPIDREASGESDPPLLPQIDFLQVDGRSLDDYEHRSEGAEWSGGRWRPAKHGTTSVTVTEEVMAEFIKMISIVSRMNGGRGGGGVC